MLFWLVFRPVKSIVLEQKTSLSQRTMQSEVGALVDVADHQPAGLEPSIKEKLDNRFNIPPFFCMDLDG